MSKALLTRDPKLGFSSLSKWIPPTFLTPILTIALRTPSSQLSFSTSPAAFHRRRKPGNKNRGVSALRRTGLRFAVGMSKYPLPKPNFEKAGSLAKNSDTHGLWEFFHSRQDRIIEPRKQAEHGRPWTHNELRGKSWEDLHALWWICCKERNRISTESTEARRLKAGSGDSESRHREMTVRRTQKAIKTALTERWYAWEDARKIAEKDATVDLNADLESPAYTPPQKGVNRSLETGRDSGLSEAKK